MEILLLFVGYVIFKIIFNATTSTAINTVKHEITNRFDLQIVSDSIEIEGHSYETFSPKIKGVIKVPSDHTPALITVELFDVTDGTEKPVLCLIDHFNYEDTHMFFYSQSTVIPYRYSEFSSWVDVFSVPKETLIFPYSGDRKLKFTAKIIGLGGAVHEEVSKTISHTAKAVGYLEAKENSKRIQERTIQLAVYAALMDGSIERKEAAIINQWVEENAESKGDAEKLRYIIKDAVGQCMGRTFDLSSVTDDIKRFTDMGTRHDIIELLMKIIAGDGVLTGDESKTIKIISKKIDMDEDLYRGLSEKLIPVTIHASVKDVDNLLGLSENMTAQEKKDHLRKEYSKWNQRVNHNDPQVREQANMMLELIATERSKL